MKKLSIDYRNYYLILDTGVHVRYMYIKIWTFVMARFTILYNHGCDQYSCYMYIVQYCTIMAVIMHLYVTCTLYNHGCDHAFVCYMYIVQSWL